MAKEIRVDREKLLGAMTGLADVFSTMVRFQAPGVNIKKQSKHREEENNIKQDDQRDSKFTW